MSGQKKKKDIKINFQYDIKEPKMLMDSMQGMLAAIVKTEDLYNEEKNYAHGILQASPVPFLVLKEGFKIDFINNEFLELFKCDLEIFTNAIASFGLAIKTISKFFIASLNL